MYEDTKRHHSAIFLTASFGQFVIRCCRDRNFDILAAVFTEVLDYMHDDLGLIPHESIQSSEAGSTSPE